MLYDGQKPKDTLTLDVYAHGYSSFELYEDDGLTREHRNGAFSKTLLECDAPNYGEPGVIFLTIHPSIGDFEGKLAERAYWCEVHCPIGPGHGVSLDGVPLAEYASVEDLKNAESGYYYDYSAEGGLAYVKTEYLPTDTEHVIVLDFEMGTGEDPSAVGIRVYPNPTRNIIFIERETGKDMRVQVSDTNGRVIFREHYGNIANKPVSVDLGGYPDGTYFVTVEIGKEKVVKKVVVIE
jgi:hypothetical protein